MKKSGQCHCGAVTFEVNAEPARMAQCHCEACRRLTGTGHVVQAFFKKCDVKICGATKTHKSIADSGNTRTRHFCPECGSRLFAENTKNPDAIGVFVGAFDNSDWFRPEVIYYSSQRQKWDMIDETIERHNLM